MMKTVGFLAIALAACGGDDAPADATTAKDAPHTTIDAPHSTIDAPATTDAPASNACTGAVYDACNPAGGGVACGTGLMCKNYMSAGFSACVPTCSTSNPCPTQGGAAVMCNNMGFCRPNAANNCTP